MHHQVPAFWITLRGPEWLKLGREAADASASLPPIDL